MITKFISLATLGLSIAGYAQTQDFAVVERGPHHRVMQRNLTERLPGGGVMTRTSRITELASNLHVNRGGVWTETNARLTLLPDGSAATANDLPFKLTLPADLYSSAILVITAEGERLVTRPAGLVYAQGTNQWLAARLKECTGELLPDGTGVIWRDAFDGVAADVVALCSPVGLQAEVILRGDLPAAEAAFGFDPTGEPGAEPPRLQLWTEVLEGPDPSAEAVLDQSTVGTNTPAMISGRGGLTSSRPAIPDSTLRFTPSAAMGRGTAFRIGPGEAATNSVPVSKSWIRTTDQRRFLIEQLPLEPVAQELRKLHSASGRKPASGKRGVELAATLSPGKQPFVLPPARPVQPKATAPMELASSGYASEPGFLVDYNLLIGTVGSYTVPAGTTAHVVGAFYVNQLVLEGTAVLKFSNTPSARIVLSGPLVCQTSDFAPCILTSASDESVGESVPGSTGSPSMLAQAFIEDWSDADNLYQHLRFRYSTCGVSIPSQFRENQVWHCQFIQCDTGVAGSSQGKLALYNNLFVDCGKAVWGCNSFVAQNVTADRCGAFANSPSGTFTSATITNGILTGVTNIVASIVLSSTTTAGIGTGIYQTVGAGEHYLQASLRGTGTTNLHPALLGDLRRLTTQPPVVYSNVTFSLDTTLTPQAPRSTALLIDNGYHYAPLDFALKTSELASGYTLRVLPGTVLGTFGSTGLRQAGGSQIICEGGPSAWNRVVRCNLVQENPVSTWNGSGASFKGDCLGATGSATATFRFTDWAAAGGDQHILSVSNPRVFGFRDCSFTGGAFTVGMPDLGLTNCLFSGVSVYIDDFGQEVSFSPTLQTCTFAGGSLRLDHFEGGVWSVYNSLFHQVNIPTNDIGPITADHNAYSSATTRIPPYGTGDILENVRFETGPLGCYYLPTNSALIYAGSTSATNLGLYHFTTGVEQRKAGTNLVSIGNHYVALGDPATNAPWVNDSPLPTGAQPLLLNDTWTWLTTPSPAAGSQFHRSDIYNAIHQHYFENATSTLTFGPEDVFFVYVRLGYTNLPGELMLQWQANDSTSWYHRAYWGTNQISGWGSRRYMGPLPVTNAWVRLEVAARDVNLVGKTIVGVAFTLNGGTVDWDYAGKRTVRTPADGDADGLCDVVEDWNGNGIYDGTDLSSYLLSDTDGDGVNDAMELGQGRNPKVSGTTGDTSNQLRLNIYTPIK